MSLVDAHTTVVDLKKKWMHRCVCYCIRIESVTFNPVLDESTVGYCVSNLDILEETKVIS